jgi:hypothetical protein
MTLSAEDRRRNMNEALIEFFDELADQYIRFFRIVRINYPNVLPTTWKELTDRHWIRAIDANDQLYEFTATGYREALKQSGRDREPQFLEGIGKLLRVLKDSVKGRTCSSLIPFEALVQQSGVSREFAYNALDADLIRHVLKRNGAEWDGGNVVQVPPNFGIRLE